MLLQYISAAVEKLISFVILPLFHSNCAFNGHSLLNEINPQPLKKLTERTRLLCIAGQSGGKDYKAESSL